MPIIKLQGLRGLPGLNRLSEKDRENFYAANSDILNSKNFKNLTAMDKAADILYNNKQFVNKFGQKVFDQYNDGTENSYNLRNNLLKNSIIEDTWKQYTSAFSPFDSKGLARSNNVPHWNTTDWAKYNDMSPDAKLKLMESDWLSPKEFEDNWNKRKEQISTLKQNPFMVALNNSPEAQGTISGNTSEADKQFKFERNKKILENIYNNDLKDRTNALGSAVSQTYLSDPLIANLSDNQVKKAFYDNFVSDNSDMVKLGAGEFASHWGSSEMKDFSIDDMRQALAKKKVYMQNMSPVAASTALNNEAKEYIKDHQGSIDRAGLFLRDVGISALSYTADKINGIWEPVRWAEDGISGKPTVWMDNTGKIIDPKRIITDRLNNSYWVDDDTPHPVRQVQLSRSALHQMGKNYDGSEDEGILNPQYWSRAEQFGTLDSDEQKQYERLGSSPYKVAYDPNEDTDLWYEAFKMSSFGIADAASQLIPFGIGMAGRALSTASKVGRVARGLGKAIDTVGKGLTAQSRVGQFIQGTAGATGIAYAYGRGAFQETLAQNMANAEETINNKARNQIYNEYNTNKSFKRLVDMRIDERAAKLKQQYLKQVQNDGGMKVADMKAVDKLVHSQAQEEYLNDLVTNRVSDLKRGKDWADLQQEAISSAGNTAIATYLPEAVKYGLVNNFGFRKYLYTNPSGGAKKVSSSLKGLKEITTEGGKQRLATEASKFLTRGDKWKQLGKTALSQAWGGAWTNGTDDMMTDAAERINNDSFDRYLNGYYNGQAIADTYGFADGLYSYLKGFSNSLGQGTTMNSTAVGALGSLVSFSPNFANMAHLATREGREAYRNQFQQRYVRNNDGTIQRNEDGSPKIEKISPRENWRERANFFIQNGVLNTYYGKKQGERDLQNHADYVNGILDDYNDFEDITNLVASDRAIEEAANDGDKKTARFIKALHAVNTLNNLANSDKDPATMSSVVQNAKALVDNLSEMDFDPEKDNVPDDGSAKSLIAQYYASNPSVAQNPYNDRVALSTMIKNAKELQSATDTYNKAEEEIQKAERNYGEPFAIPVREKLKLNQALDGHWRDRLESMKNELNDTSTDEEVSDEDILPSLGGKKNAETLVRAYNRQEKELTDALNEQQKQVDETKKKYDESQQELENNTDDSKTYDLQKKTADAKAKYDDALLQKGYIQEQITTTNTKRNRVSNAITEANKEGATEKKVLTADEIFNLDPVTRARMMDKDNRDLYSQEQKNEIEKLEHRLTMQDADALQKIQDISTLTQRIEANSDAYNRIMQNPEAAAVRFEAQKSQAAIAAYNFINQRNAQTVADFVNQMDDGLSAHKDISQEDKENIVYKMLRKFNSSILSTINDEGLLPNYQKQVTDAKDWKDVVEDLDSVISNSDKSEDWKKNIRQNINNIVETANTKDEIIANIEKAIDDVDNSQVKEDLDYILQGMTNLGYHRDATILENRAKRKERENKEKAAAAERDAKEKALKDKVNKAAEDEKAAKEAEAAKKATEEEALENAQINNPVTPNGDNITPTAEVDKSKQAENAERTGEGESIDLGIKPSSLMENDAEESTMDAGEIWYSNNSNSSKGNLSVSVHPSKATVNAHTTDRSITFNINNHAETITIAPNEWSALNVDRDSPNAVAITNGEMKENGITNYTPFKADSLQRIDGDWYASGQFEGLEGKTRVKLADNFNLDKAIEREKASREALYATDSNLIDNGDTVSGRNETIDEQTKDAEKDGSKQYSSDENVDSEKINDATEATMENTDTTLTGNAMIKYVVFDKKHPDSPSLKNGGVLVSKKGEVENDSRNRYNAWMDNAGIKLQNIIDTELSQILERNPHTKIKFMYVNPAGKGTDDTAMQSHLLLAVDYDDSINKGITSIHNEDNGGVITSNGKQYLVVGVAGYGSQSNTSKRDFYDILMSNSPKTAHGYGIIRTESHKFFTAYPEERYYVNEKLSTEVVPMSLIPGYIVRQLESDSNPEYRDISEILKDKNRNPKGLVLKDLAWGIQEMNKFLIVFPKGAKEKPVMMPRNAEDNMGRAFVLIPAANGKLVPSYLRPLFYADVESNGSVMREGELKNEVYEHLNELTSQDYDTRLRGIIGLTKIFHFDNDNGNGILTTKPTSSQPVVSFLHNGQVFKSFNLSDSSFNRQDLFNAFETMNPRVNITYQVLHSPELLEMYDEAGALQTDAALLHTAGASYSIYAVDADGNMLGETKTPENTIQTAPVNDGFRKDSRQVVFKHNLYTYTNGKYYLNGKEVTDAKDIEQLEYNRRIFVENTLEPSVTNGVWNTYILSKGEHPEVVKVNKNTYEVKKYSEADAKALIEKIDKKNDNKERKNAAEEALQTGEAQDVDLGLGGTNTDTTIATSASRQKLIDLGVLEKDTATPPIVKNASDDSDGGALSGNDAMRAYKKIEKVFLDKGSKEQMNIAVNNNGAKIATDGLYTIYKILDKEKSGELSVKDAMDYIGSLFNVKTEDRQSFTQWRSKQLNEISAQVENKATQSKALPLEQAVRQIEGSSQISFGVNQHDKFTKELDKNDDTVAFIGNKTGDKTATFIPESWNRIKVFNDLPAAVNIHGNPNTAKSIKEVIPGRIEQKEYNGHKYWQITQKATIILNNAEASKQEAEQDFNPETGEVYDKFNPKPETQTMKPKTPSADKATTQTFKELRENPKYKRRIMMALMTKWKDAPKDINKLMDYLRSKNVEVDAIGTSDADIDAWIKTNIECR